MDEFELTAEEESIKSQLGRNAVFWRYDRTTNTPMNFFLQTVERQVNSQFSVYWVSHGLPEVFCLRRESRTTITFSERYLELVGFIRHSIVEDTFADLRVELVERTCLKLIAEFALRYGDPNFAVLSFLKSIVGKDIYVFDTNTLLALEHSPINEAYMATWFYGLAHEVGHVASHQLEMSIRDGLFSDETILDGIKIALDHFSYPETLEQRFLTKASNCRSEFILGLDNLRSEGLADMFAASLLCESTFNIMGMLKSEPFRFERFIREMTIFLNIISIIQRCRQVAQIASQPSHAQQSVQENLALHPVSIYVRALMMREYLEHYVASFLFNSENISRKQLKQISKLFDEINHHLSENIQAIDTGVARAIRFALFPEEHDAQLFEKFTHEVSCENTFPSISEAQQFCELADMLEVHGERLCTLRSLISSG